MRTSTFLLLSLLFLCNFGAAAKEYSVNKGAGNNYSASDIDTVVIITRFADVEIVHWDKNTITTDLTATVKSNDRKKAVKILEDIKLSSEKKGRKVEAKASFGSDRGNDKTDFDITVRVYIPHDMAVRIDSQFSDISSDDFGGPLTVASNFGDLNMRNVVDGSFALQFCDRCNIGSCRNVSLRNSYSNVKIETVDTLRATDSFGTIKVGTMKAAGLGLSYSKLTVNRLRTSIRANMSFSDMDLTVDSNFRLIELKGNYSDVDIHLPETAAFDVETKNMKYGSCKIKDFATRVVSPEQGETRGYDSTRRRKNDETRIAVNGGAPNSSRGQIIFNGRDFSDLTIKAL